MSGRTENTETTYCSDRTCLTQNGKFTALTVGFSRRNQKTFRRRFKHTSGHLIKVAARVDDNWPRQSHP